MKSALTSLCLLVFCPMAVMAADASAAEKSPRELCIEQADREMRAMMERSNFLVQAERQKREGLAAYDQNDEVLARLTAHHSSRLKPGCGLLPDTPRKTSTVTTSRFSATRGGAIWKADARVKAGAGN